MGEQLISLKMIQPPRFGLPQDVKRPVVFSSLGGRALGHFGGCFRSGCGRRGPGENWLFFGTRIRDELFYEDELQRMVADERLHLRVAVSREDVAIWSEDGRIHIEPGSRHYIGEELLKPDNAWRLWQLLRPKSEGGEGAYLYVCGRTGFAGSVMAGGQEIVGSVFGWHYG